MRLLAQESTNNNWRGLVSNASPHALPPGAMQEQVNLYCLEPGVLTPRRGMRATTFTNTADAAAGDIIELTAISRPDATYVVWENANGEIRYGRAPA